MKQIPVTLVTGFLGAGKTSLLNALLRDPEFAETALLINEFGDVQVDHDLVAEFSDELITTTTGCLCCTASSDIKQSLFDLWRRRKDREIGPFRRVFVETTGLLDPAPVLNSLLTPHAPGLVDNIVKNQFALSQVIALFDAVNGAQSLDDHAEALRQVAFADVVILTKTDLPSRDGSAPLNGVALRRLRSVNPSARILDRHADWKQLRALFRASGAYDLRTKGEDAIAWLDAERAHAEAHDHAHHHHQDPNRHGDDILSHVIFIDQPIAGGAMRAFIEMLKRRAGADLLRIKGLIALADDPERPVVLHGVQHLVHPIVRLDRWPSDDRRTRIVMIGRNLSIEIFRESLSASTA